MRISEGLRGALRDSTVSKNTRIARQRYKICDAQVRLENGKLHGEGLRVLGSTL